MNTTNLNNGSLKYDVLVEQNNENGYTARMLAWADCVVQAPTRAEALEKMEALIRQRLTKEDIVALEIQPAEPVHSWLPFAGDWADNPYMDEFRAEIERYRREVDAIHAPWLLEPEETIKQQAEAEAVPA